MQCVGPEQVSLTRCQKKAGTMSLCQQHPAHRQPSPVGGFPGLQSPATPGYAACTTVTALEAGCCGAFQQGAATALQHVVCDISTLSQQVLSLQPQAGNNNQQAPAALAQPPATPAIISSAQLQSASSGSSEDLSQRDPCQASTHDMPSAGQLASSSSITHNQQQALKRVDLTSQQQQQQPVPSVLQPPGLPLLPTGLFSSQVTAQVVFPQLCLQPQEQHPWQHPQQYQQLPKRRQLVAVQDSDTPCGSTTLLLAPVIQPLYQAGLYEAGFDAGLLQVLTGQTGHVTPQLQAGPGALQFQLPAGAYNTPTLLPGMPGVWNEAAGVVLNGHLHAMAQLQQQQPGAAALWTFPARQPGLVAGSKAAAGRDYSSVSVGTKRRHPATSQETTRPAGSPSEAGVGAALNPAESAAVKPAALGPFAAAAAAVAAPDAAGGAAGSTQASAVAQLLGTPSREQAAADLSVMSRPELLQLAAQVLGSPASTVSTMGRTTSTPVNPTAAGLQQHTDAASVPGSSGAMLLRQVSVPEGSGAATRSGFSSQVLGLPDTLESFYTKPMSRAEAAAEAKAVAAAIAAAAAAAAAAKVSHSSMMCSDGTMTSEGPLLLQQQQQQLSMAQGPSVSAAADPAGTGSNRDSAFHAINEEDLVWHDEDLWDVAHLL